MFMNVLTSVLPSVSVKEAYQTSNYVMKLVRECEVTPAYTKRMSPGAEGTPADTTGHR